MAKGDRLPFCDREWWLLRACAPGEYVLDRERRLKSERTAHEYGTTLDI
jgi:hypothetical protein